MRDQSPMMERGYHHNGRMDHRGEPVIVIGAGPVGLAAAARLHERGIAFAVLEAGDTPGAAVRQWGHVRLFSPWRFNIDAAAARLLGDAGWVRPEDGELPTGAQLADDYLRPLADLPEIKPHVRYEARVIAITRLGLDPVPGPSRHRRGRARPRGHRRFRHLGHA